MALVLLVLALVLALIAGFLGLTSAQGHIARIHFGWLAFAAFIGYLMASGGLPS
jgi:hypothetical protein